MSMSQVSDSGAWRNDFLLETIVCGLHETALQILAFSTLIEAYLRTGVDHGLPAFRHLLFDDGKVMRLALAFGNQIGMPGPLTDRLKTLYRDLSAAKAHTAPLADFNATHAVRRNQMQSKSLPQVWRGLAQEALTSVRDLIEIAGARVDEIYHHDAATVRACLKQIVEGKIVLDEGGAPGLPKLRQRRIAPRLKIRQACKLVLPSGAAYPCELVDVSRNGLALNSDISLAIGQQVLVELADGRRLAAKVRRSQGRTFGLALETDLLPGELASENWTRR